MPRITRIAVSFFAVATAYWLYALIAVPFIEPTTSRRAEGSAEFSDRRNGASRLDQRLASLAELFPADSWVLKNPKILESDQFQLLTQDYRNRGDGRLELRPCAIVVTPEGPAETEQQRRRRAIVLEAPEGAVLEFDRPLDLRRGSMGQIVGGQLQGRVIIRSQGESPGPEDDLLIVTRDVEMTRANVFTPHVVDFRFGPHHGRGRELRIKLLEGTADKGQPTPNVTGVELFELRKVERLHLQMGQMASAQAGASRAKSGGPPATSAAGALGDMADVPVEITCEGPFRFDVPGKVASFQDKVRVVRLNPNGRNDQLNCDQLAIYFEERAEAKGQATLLRDGKTLALTSAKKGKVSMDLVPQRLEATGKPVTMSAPNQGVEARGRLLRYNLINGQVLLEDDREAMLRQEANEIHAQRLVYQPDQSGRLGQMAAEGPGWLRGHSPERPDEPLEVSWKKEARVYPEKDQQVVKVDGSAWLRFRGIGQLDAETVLFRLNELPPDKGETQRRLQPDRMEAAQNVSIRSPQLDGAVDELTVVFEQQTPGAGIPWRPGGRPAGQSERTRTDSGRSVALAPAVFRQPSTIAPSGAVEADVTRPVHYVASAASPSAAALIAAAPSAASASVAAPAGVVADRGLAGGGVPGSGEVPRSEAPSGEAPSSEMPRDELAGAPPAQRFEVTGKKLHARVRLGEETTQLAEVSVDGDARFAETQTAQPEERPVSVRGQRIHVTDAETPRAAVTVTGEPAQFEGRGMAIESRHIHLNRGTNRLLIDGAGTMLLPLDRDLNGQPLASSGRMAVDWRHRMEFDGRTARFEESVVARTEQQSLRTESLEVQFRQPIRLSDADLGAPPQVEQILCQGGTLLESRTMDGPRFTAFERMQTGDLTVNLLSGDLNARGAGWLMSIRLASEGAPFGGPSGSFLAPQAPAANVPELPLRQLYVRFQGGMTGNIHQRQLNFHDNVRTIYTPVDTWQPPVPSDDPHSLGPRGIVMNCNRLSLRQALRPDGSQHSAEFEAAGNTIVESASYTARAIRMTYSEAKDLLVLEGDGRSDAQLFRQQQIGGPMAQAAAQRILFWPGANRLKVDGARSLELSQFRQ